MKGSGVIETIRLIQSEPVFCNQINGVEFGVSYLSQLRTFRITASMVCGTCKLQLIRFCDNNRLLARGSAPAKSSLQNPFTKD
jgi:hypothetical protein